MMATVRRRDRQGVLILVVLSMLVMFVLVAVAFVISASQHRSAARSASRRDLTGNPPQQLLDEAMRQLLRDTTNSNSALHNNSLLADMYGDGTRWKLTTPATNVDHTGGQFVEFDFDTRDGSINNSTAEQYAGRVLTFTSGNAKGVSTRIISQPTLSTLKVLRPATAVLPENGSEFVINGRPFSGSGESGSPNEDWDAPDDKNLHLAAIIPDSTALSGIHIIPSFDRTQPGDHLNTKRAFPWGGAAPWDKASNPYPWDVDNDGDGIADSIWIDAGFPVQSAPDGRLYKALVAILCLDMDGRLNLNAHGSLAHLPSGRPTAYLPLAGGATTTQAMPRGEGYGPPEISLEPVLGARYVNYLQGLDIYRGRYGLASATPLPGNVNGVDPAAQIHLFQYPELFGYQGGAFRSAFTTPSNLRGNLAFGVGPRGTPIYDGLDTDQLTNSPYQLDLSSTLPITFGTDGEQDAPFTVGELERLLRAYDRDAAALPNRLLELAGPTPAEQAVIIAERHKLTTHSFDLPVYSGNLRTQLLNRGVPAASLTTAPTLVAPELLMGLRMNLNRPFGNARDDSSTGVVDSEDEAGSEPLWSGAPAPYSNGVEVDRDNDGVADDASSTERAKQIYARQLFTLLMLVNDVDPAETERVREIAQWSVNVVDFYDADSIMTRFDYDPNPFDGSWTPTETVWGLERPELLITETLAFHDRRTADTASAFVEGGGTDTRTDDEMDPDEDLDQTHKPRSGFFVELYNPWHTHDTTWQGHGLPPGELYSDDGNGPGVDLTRLAEGVSPVWRVIVVKGESRGRDPEHPDPAERVEDADIERVVVFSSTATNAGVPVGATLYHPTPAIASATPPVRPGRYAVFGSSGDINGNDYVTPISRATNDMMPDRRIVLQTAPDPGVLVYNDGINPDPVPVPNPDPNLLPAAPVVIPIGMANVAGTSVDRSLSISDPTDGYPETHPDVDGGGVYDEVTGEYRPPIDVPFDKDREDFEELEEDGTHVQFRQIYLQRLANPLKQYNAVTNPYLTVDTMPVDLTAFNGVSNDTEDGATGTNNGFVTHQRGDNNDDPMPNNLWLREQPRTSAPVSAATHTEHYFQYDLTHTLGFLNEKYDNLADPEGHPTPEPFPWLVWNNRPFVSPLELLQVPRTRSSELTQYMRPNTGEAGNPHNSGHFEHLWDFHPETANSAFKNLYKLFDYVEVPSRFVGTRMYFNPQNFSAGNPGLYPFYAPHNSLSRYRDPGRINLNTIYSEEVWDGLMHNASALGLMPHAGPTWGELVRSRRGYGTSNEILDEAGATSSFFERPFRSFDFNASGTGIADSDKWKHTLLRNIDPGAGSRPLFYEAPTGVPDNMLPHRNAERNTYFRHQPIQRLSNLVTTRSNVYAVWITLGYFEANADGSLKSGGVELGSDTGEIRRHRAFYLIDRSIPVAFEQGENHNSENAVLLKRFIE